jgi:hypothetical protein
LADDFLSDEDKAFLGMGGPSAPAPVKPRGLWSRFYDNFILGAVDSPWGAEGLVRATTDLPADELNRRERVLRDRLIKRNEQDPAWGGRNYPISQGEIVEGLADFAGGIFGSVDPTWILNPGRGIATRAASQAGINTAVDASGQAVQIKRGVRDEYDPIQTGVGALAGAGLSAGSDVISRRLARGGDTNLDVAKGIGEKFGTVTSTLRSPERNKKVGGAKNSHHLRGNAIDIARGKGVTHKQLERAYRRAGFELVESLDEGDHSHFAFNFKKGKGGGVIEDFDFNPKEQGPDPLGDIRLVRDELPEIEEMARVNQALLREADDSDVVPMRFDDPISENPPILDSSYDKYTPYVERPNDPANENLGDVTRDPTDEELDELLKEINPDPKYWAEDVLTPAERQEMDASAIRPEAAPHTPKGLGKGENGKPANDQVIHSIADARQQKELKDFHKGLMSSVADRVQVYKELVSKVREAGLLPFEIGDRFTTPKGRQLKQGPWRVAGYYADPKDPNRYGYRVERGSKKADDYESATILVSDPKADAERIKRGWEPFDRAADVTGWKKLGDIKEADVAPPIHRPESLPGSRDGSEDYPLPPGPNDPNFPKPGTPGNRGGPKGGDDRSVEDRLIEDLKNLKPLTGEQRALYRAERSRRASSLSNLQKGDATKENVSQQFASQRGQLPRKAYQSIAESYTDADWVNLANRINHSPKLLPFEKLNALKALSNLMAPEGAKLPTPSEIKLLSEVYSPDFIRALLDNRTFLQKVWHNVKSGLNVPRAIMSSMDFSAPFRQGIGLVHKKEFWKSLPHMFKMWASEVKSKDYIDSLKTHPRWDKAKQAGLAITDPHSHFLADKEEDFMTDWAERLPFGAGKMIAASNRAYSGFLNKLRWDTFNNLVDQLENMGEEVTDKQLKQLGKFVNMATGRGDLGKTGNAAAPALSAMLFSPRLIASRVKTLASPVTYMTADPLVRKEAWKSLLAMSGYYMTLGGIAKYMLGMDVETDPRSPDFMKAKIGNTRYDFMAGYSQYIRLGAQILTDSTITGKGEERGLTANEGYRAPTRRDVAIKFFLNKLAPVPSLVSDWMEGSDPVGEPFEWKQAIKTRMLPMASQDIAEAVEEWGPIGAAMGIPGLFGWSAQTYEPKGKEPEPVSDEDFLSGNLDEASAEGEELSAEDKEFLGL